MQLPGVLGSLPSRLSTVTVLKTLPHPGRFLVQLLGVAVGGKLTRLGSRSALPCSRHLARFAHPSLPIPEMALQCEAARPTMNRAKVARGSTGVPGRVFAKHDSSTNCPISTGHVRKGSSGARCGMQGGPVAGHRLDPATWHPTATLTGWMLQDPYRMALVAASLTARTRSSTIAPGGGSRLLPAGSGGTPTPRQGRSARRQPRRPATGCRRCGRP
jgi:hypothetical protein